MSETEFYEFGKRSSIRNLPPVEPGEEISSTSYLEFVLVHLRKEGGQSTQGRVEAAIQQHFAPVWGEADLRAMLVAGKYLRPKWLNTLDWAKVIARKQQLFYCRKHGKEVFYVLNDPSLVDQERIRWAFLRRSKNKFTRKWPKCRQWSPMADAECQQLNRRGRLCGYVFPKVNERVDKLPK